MNTVNGFAVGTALTSTLSCPASSIADAAIVHATAYLPEGFATMFKMSLQIGKATGATYEMR